MELLDWLATLFLWGMDWPAVNIIAQGCTITNYCNKSLESLLQGRIQDFADGGAEGSKIWYVHVSAREILEPHTYWMHHAPWGLMRMLSAVSS